MITLQNSWHPTPPFSRRQMRKHRTMETPTGRQNQRNQHKLSNERSHQCNLRSTECSPNFSLVPRLRRLPSQRAIHQGGQEWKLHHMAQAHRHTHKQVHAGFRRNRKRPPQGPTPRDSIDQTQCIYWVSRARGDKDQDRGRKLTF